MISELARQTTERLTQSVDNWKRFLDSAAWLYKYPFHEQVLIHAQRPDATACAPIELWNNAFKRWVNRGAKGIAIIDNSGHKPALRYVFDVSDTNTRYNVPFSLWQTRPEYEAQIIEELENHFGETGTDNADLAAIVLGVSKQAKLLRNELKLCDAITERTIALSKRQEQVKQFQREETKNKQEEQSRGRII